MPSASVSHSASSPFGVQNVFRLPTNTLTLPVGLITPSGEVTPRRLYFVLGMLTSLYPVYLRLYDTAVAPTPGAGTPKMTLPLTSNTAYNGSALVAAPNAFEFSFNDVGITFFQGIGYTITKNPSDTDTTVLVAGDVTGLNIGWQ